MNLRERLADWISGGALLRAWEEAHFWRAEWQRNSELLGRAKGVGLKRQSTFRAIIAETDRDPSRPSVKRIARIAREALE